MKWQPRKQKAARPCCVRVELEGPAAAALVRLAADSGRSASEIAGLGVLLFEAGTRDSKLLGQGRRAAKRAPVETRVGSESWKNTIQDGAARVAGQKGEK